VKKYIQEEFEHKMKLATRHGGTLSFSIKIVIVSLHTMI